MSLTIALSQVTTAIANDEGQEETTEESQDDDQGEDENNQDSDEGDGEEKEETRLNDEEEGDNHASHQECGPGVCLHWTKPSGSPRELIAINNTQDPWRPRLDGRAQEWSQPNDINMSVTAGSTDASLRQNCPQPENYRRIRVCSYNYNNPNWLGKALTAYNPSNGHIQHGVVKLDDADPPSLDADGQRHVMCHELGHNLGLKHWNTDGNNSCMNVNHVNSASYDQPAGHDINQVDSQTHYHGGSGANVDTGDTLNGDLVDCINSTCFTFEHAHRQISATKALFILKVRLVPYSLVFLSQGW